LKVITKILDLLLTMAGSVAAAGFLSSFVLVPLSLLSLVVPTLDRFLWEYLFWPILVLLFLGVFILMIREGDIDTYSFYLTLSPIFKEMIRDNNRKLKEMTLQRLFLRLLWAIPAALICLLILFFLSGLLQLDHVFGWLPSVSLLYLSLVVFLVWIGTANDRENSH